MLIVSVGLEDDGALVVVGGIRGDGVCIRTLDGAVVGDIGVRVLTEGAGGADLDVVCSSTFFA